MHRPGKRIIPAMLYPLVDATLLFLSLSLTIVLVLPPDSLADFRANLTMRLPVWCGVPFIMLAASGVYNRVWSRARPSEFGLLGVTLIGAFGLCLAVRMIVDPTNAARSFLIAIAHGGMSIGLVLGIRTLPRLVQDMMMFMSNPRSEKSIGGTLIYGAGTRGILYLRRKSYRAGKDEASLKVLGFLDDDIGLRRRKVHGYMVYGGWNEMSMTIEELRPSEIILTCGLEATRTKKLEELCQEKKIRLIEWVVGEKIIVDAPN